MQSAISNKDKFKEKSLSESDNLDALNYIFGYCSLALHVGF
jgi:hypothetical protein